MPVIIFFFSLGFSVLVILRSIGKHWAVSWPDLISLFEALECSPYYAVSCQTVYPTEGRKYLWGEQVILKYSRDVHTNFLEIIHQEIYYDTNLIYFQGERMRSKVLRGVYFVGEKMLRKQRISRNYAVFRKWNDSKGSNNLRFILRFKYYMNLNWIFEASRSEYWNILELSVRHVQCKPKSLDEPKLFTWFIKCFMDKSLFCFEMRPYSLLYILPIYRVFFLISLQLLSLGIKRCELQRAVMLPSCSEKCFMLNGYLFL